MCIIGDSIILSQTQDKLQIRLSKREKLNIYFFHLMLVFVCFDYQGLFAKKTCNGPK